MKKERTIRKNEKWKWTKWKEKQNEQNKKNWKIKQK